MANSFKRASVGSTYSSKKKLVRDSSSSRSSDAEANPESQRGQLSKRSRLAAARKDSLKQDNGRDEDAKSSDDDASSDEKEEVYEVEKIKAHRRDKDGKLRYKVKWKGYDSQDDSWEPVHHLLPGAQELLRVYREQHSISSASKSRLSTTSSKSAQRSRDREPSSDLSESSASESRPQSKKRKRGDPESKKIQSASLRKNSSNGPSNAESDNVKKRVKSEAIDSEVDSDSVNDEEWHARYISRSSWETLVRSVRTIVRDSAKDDPAPQEPEEGGAPYDFNVALLWRTGRTSWVSRETARAKVPQKMLDFYEKHLQFAEPDEGSQSPREPPAN